MRNTNKVMHHLVDVLIDLNKVMHNPVRISRILFRIMYEFI